MSFAAGKWKFQEIFHCTNKGSDDRIHREIKALRSTRFIPGSPGPFKGANRGTGSAPPRFQPLEGDQE
jgi:hypothetical protein